MNDAAGSEPSESPAGEERSPGTRLAFEDSIELASTKDAIWPKLSDPELLGASIPGAQRVDRQTDRRYAIEVERGVSRFTVSLDGEVEIVEMQEPDWMVIEGQAYDSRTHSEFGGIAAMEMTQTGDGTVDLAYKATLTLSGMSAVLTPRMLRPVIESDVEQFFSNIASNLESKP